MANYKFIFSELADMANTIKKNSQNRIQALNTLQLHINSFVGSQNISGETAESVTTYFANAYTPIITSLVILINHHAQQCIKYIKYYEAADLGGSTRVDTHEQDDLSSHNKAQRLTLVHDKGYLSNGLNILSECGVAVPAGVLSQHDTVTSEKLGLNSQIDKLKNDIETIENYYKTQKDDYAAQLNASLNVLLSKMRSAEVPNYTAGKDFFASPEMDGMRKAALALWYQSFLSQDSEDLGLGERYTNYQGLKDFAAFDIWTEEDVEKFRKLQFIPFDKWPEEYKQYFDWNSRPNGYPRNGLGGNCVWYAFGRFMMIQGKTFAIGPGGDAYDWYSVASGRGYTTGLKPKVGSILCWDYAGGGNGHVAFIEKMIAPSEKYPYGAVLVSQSSWSGNGPSNFANMDICPLNEDGSVAMVYNGYTRTDAIYQGCIYPDKDYNQRIITPFGKATKSDLNFINELAKGNKPAAYNIEDAPKETPTQTKASSNISGNPDPKINGTLKRDNTIENGTISKGNPDPKTNGTLKTSGGDNSKSHKDFVDTSKNDPDPKTNKNLKTEHETKSEQHKSTKAPHNTADKPTSDNKQNNTINNKSYNSSKQVGQTVQNAGDKAMSDAKASVADKSQTSPKTSQSVDRLSDLDIESLQKKLNVSVDGGIGPETISAIQKEVGATVDGYWGAETSSKIQEYLGVEVDGYAGTETLTALNEWATK